MMKVFELAHSGRGSGREGLYATVDLAKARAEQLVKEYQAYVEEDPEGVEGMVEDPQWEIIQEYLGRDQRLRIGDPKPTLIFGELGSAFTVREVTVHEELS